MINELLADPNSAAIINSISVINVPANMPEPQKQAIYNRVAGTIHPMQQQTLNLRCMLASIESPSSAKVFYNDLIIAYWRDMNYNLSFNITAEGSGWI